MMSCQVKKHADLIVTNGTIYTVDGQFRTYNAMAVNDSLVGDLGTDRKILDGYSSDNIVDADGCFVYPGFIDGHSHFSGYATNLYEFVDLKGTRSFEEILELLSSEKSSTAGKWILGSGWDQNDWPVQAYPDNKVLDELFPDNPVMLIRIDGHAVLVNSLALRLAGIDSNTRIDGGEVLLDNGHMTGMLIDSAADSLMEAVPRLSDDALSEALVMAQQKLFAAGLTCVTDAGIQYRIARKIDELQRAGPLKIRVCAMLEPTEDNLQNFILKGPYLTDRLTIRSIKMYADGALGSRGALLLQPYSDNPGNFGLKIHTDDYYRKWIKIAFDNGYQVNTHCIGDSANRFMLKLYGEILKGVNDRRWRIEHAQVVAPGDFPLFGQYNIIPSIQSTHCTSDMYWAEERLGPERIKEAYAYKQLLDQNGWLVNGTDFPVEDINPILTFYAAVTRQDLQGYPTGGFQPENALSREEALRSITIWPAMGSFDEGTLGSLEIGKKADFVILDRDLMEVPEERIPGTDVMKTFIDGQLVYENQ